MVQDDAWWDLLSLFQNLTKEWHSIGNDGIFPISAIKYDHAHIQDQYHLAVFLHYENFQIWHQEDHARSGVMERVFRAKQNIDVHNQTRNDLIEKLDVFFETEHQKPPKLLDPDYKTVRWSSETPGSLIDRISILALKIYHYKEFVEQGKEQFKSRVDTLVEQLEFLNKCLHRLLAEISSGISRIKVFRQHKTYNNPETNPHHEANAPH